uniref:non-specific serine/threonine protein kinase n=1 Tax=Meloidogyne enterolobii TaxID=390850 RepID=A0A6V7TQ27_MELEN|nr:unnamed protein product [Meloidogyne enterolobii]
MARKSLASLKRKQFNHIFSLNTAFYCALEALEALKFLHKLGYVHRDVKPSNYCIGLQQTNCHNTIYLIDYSLARKILCDDGTIKKPRSKVLFKGSVRFAPIAMHKGVDCSYKDDLESWIYTLADMIIKNKVPWHMEEAD